MRATLTEGHIAEISVGGLALHILESDRSKLFTVVLPANDAFYQFASHAQYGECPIISYDPGHAVNGWTDSYSRIDVGGQGIERLNSWR